MERFSMLLAICAGNSPVPAQRPVTEECVILCRIHWLVLSRGELDTGTRNVYSQKCVNHWCIHHIWRHFLRRTKGRTEPNRRHTTAIDSPYEAHWTLPHQCHSWLWLTRFSLLSSFVNDWRKFSIKISTKSWRSLVQIESYMKLPIEYAWKGNV